MEKIKSNLVNLIIEEAEGLSIRLSIEGEKRGCLDFKSKDMYINPIHWEDRAEIFLTEMLSYIGANREIPQEIGRILEDKYNKNMITKYIDSRV